MKVAVVTATLDPARAKDCVYSWTDRAVTAPMVYLVSQCDERGLGAFPAWEERPTLKVWRRAEILGVVPAFAIGVQKALEDGAEIIACFHDDLLIEQDGWDQQVIEAFTYERQAGLLGFGGGKGLGDADIYQTPYNPMQLARKDFLSNMRDAEAHGRRVTWPEQVSCLDGFSQIGRRDFWLGHIQDGHDSRHKLRELEARGGNLFAQMQQWGIIHHAYDAALGCFAKRLGWQVWMLPIQCHHFGGQTAVADPRYHQWANLHPSLQIWHEGVLSPLATGDQAFWQQAHKIVYDQFKDTLPIRL